MKKKIKILLIINMKNLKKILVNYYLKINFLEKNFRKLIKYNKILHK